MRTLAGSRASLSPSRSSPIELLALYAPPRERVRRAVSALDEGKDLQPQSARNEYVEKGGDSATSSAGVAGLAVELTMRIPLVARKPQASTLGELT
jgi:hypothetical protein